MSLGGIFTFYFRLSLGASLERIATALLSAVAAGLLEEIFFRGIVFKALLEDWKPSIAFVIASCFYSALHFVKPVEKIILSGPDPWAGFRHLGYAFMPFLDPVTLFPGLFGLFLIGIVLAYAFARTGSIYLSVGLHAGWIFGLKTIRVYGDYRRQDLGWLFGSSEPKLVTGVAAWIGIVVVGIIVHLITRRRTLPV
jgi:membrane protease YdiL (CAAX protease family)